MRILLDSSVIIDALRRPRGRVELLRALLEEGYQWVTCDLILACILLCFPYGYQPVSRISSLR